MTLAPIRKSNEEIGADYAPSFNAASEALEQAFGFAPVVLRPLGGARTKAQCDSLGTPWNVSDHYEGKGRAVDIDNQRRFRNIDGDLFERILYQYGWRNIQVNGRPFPREPWHFANHDVSPWKPQTSPAGTPPTHIRDNATPSNGDELMPSYIHISSGADNGSFAVGQRLVQDPATGVFRALTAGEFGLLEVTQPGIIWAQWSPATALDYTSRLGLREYVADPSIRGGVGKLTGRIIYPTA